MHVLYQPNQILGIGSSSQLWFQPAKLAVQSHSPYGHTVLKDMTLISIDSCQLVVTRDINGVSFLTPVGLVMLTTIT